MKKTLITLTLILTLLLALLVVPVGATEGEETTVEYYGRTALAECDNATALLYAYDSICAGIAACSSEISVYNGTDPLSEEELATVIDVHRRDRAEHFWMGNSYSVSAKKDASGNTVTVVSLYPTYLFEGDTLATAKSEVEAEVTAILAGIEGAMTDYEKLVYLYDTLAGRIEYVEGEHAHNLYGALVLGECVCEGYAEALQYLLHRAGVGAFLAIGSSENPSTGLSEGHEWNYVKLDGEWYHVDLTWDDQGESLYHAYLGVTDAVITADHSIEETAYALPGCTATTYNYFEVEGGKLSAPYSVSEIAELLTAGGKQASVLVDDTAAFTAWLDENISDIASECGATGRFSYGYSKLGREIKLYINDCEHESLTHVPATPAACDTDGNKEHYSCGTCGKLFADQFALTELTHSEVNIPKLDHSYTKNTEAEEYVKEAGNCKVNVTYWYACEHCGRSAGEDALATDKFYTGESFGDHVMDSKWTVSDAEHWHACTVEGCDYKADEGEHSYDEEKYGYKERDGHAHTCTACGAIGEVTAHASVEGGEATDDTPELCAACGYIITPKLTHGDNHEPREEWESDASEHWHDCTGCEEQQLELAPHSDEDGDLLCDVCGHAVEPKSESDPEPEPIVDPLPGLIAKLTKEQIILGAVIAGAIVILVLIIKIAGFFRRRRSRW